MGGTAWLFCINNKYYVTHDFGDDLCDIYVNSEKKQNVFEVDELIAEQLAMLCNKGYITQYSCSGHPFSSCSYKVIEALKEKENIVSEDHVAVSSFCGEEAQVVCDIYERLDDEMYIRFKQSYSFESAPVGWSYDGCTLRIQIHATNKIDFFRQILLSAEKLNDWIKLLPINLNVE